MNYFRWLLSFAVLMFGASLAVFLSSCGQSAKAESVATVEQVQPPQGWGATISCFVIRDENGKAVGGNCIPRSN